MEIKIESGANVQITDKPIVNNIVYGDVVQRKEVSLPEQSSTSIGRGVYPFLTKCNKINGLVCFIFI